MILPGQRWQKAIRDAIEGGSLFLACFSVAYTDRSRTYMNEELLLATDELRRRPRNRTWFIPVLLDPCTVPDIPIGAGETLRAIQWVDLHGHWANGIQALVRTIRAAQPEAARPLVCLMSTDIVGSTPLSESLTPTQYESAVRQIMAIQREFVSAHGGLEVDAIANGLLVSFPSAAKAVHCALEIQSEISADERAPAAIPSLRIGIHAASLMPDGKVDPKALNIAMRICFRAESGRLVISEPIQQQLNESRIQFRARNSALPVKLFIVESSAVQPQDGELDR